MKNLKYIILFVLIGNSLYAQQTPRYTHVYLNPYLINPAYAGLTDTTKAFLDYRNEMVGLRGAPITSIVTIDGKLKKLNSGVGLNTFMETQNIIARKGLNFSYSYSAKLKNDQTLVFGVSAGVAQNSLNFNEIVAENPSELLDLYNYKTTTSFNSDMGVLYLYNKLQIGFSATNMFNRKKYVESNSFSYRQNPTYIVSGLYFFELNDLFSNTTTVVLRSPQGMPARVNFNTVFFYENRIWAGINYSHLSSVGLIAGFNFGDISFGYAYDYATTKLNVVASGSHEVILGFRFLNHHKN